MPKEKDEDNIPPIAEFYNGKSIFITGTAGFVGEILLEILLRCCKGIRTIYILLREKKGMSPEERKEELFSKPFFHKLKAEDPEVFNKVRVVPGDICKPELGMREEDIMEVIENVTIVFHSAASVSFSRTLKFLLSHNLGGVNNMIELCKKLKHCEVFVHTSTLYCNYRHNLPIQERVYRLPYPAQRFLDEMNNGNDDMLEKLASACRLHEWLYKYAFSKCASENLVLEKASSIPTMIFRPSVVVSTWKGPMPGFIEDNSAFTLLSKGVAKGIIKVVYVSPDLHFEATPVDVVANGMITGAWGIATGRFQSPFVVNCAPGGMLRPTWKQLAEHNIELSEKSLLPNTLQLADHVFFTRNKKMASFLKFFYHYFPAEALDMILFLKGKKPRMVWMQKRTDKAIRAALDTYDHPFTYETHNYKALQSAGCAEDREMFYMNTDNVSFKELVNMWPVGAPFCDWTLDKKSKAERLKTARRNYYFVIFTQILGVLFMCWLLKLIFTGVYSIF